MNKIKFAHFTLVYPVYNQQIEQKYRNFCQVILELSEKFHVFTCQCQSAGNQLTNNGKLTDEGIRDLISSLRNMGCNSIKYKN